MREVIIPWYGLVLIYARINVLKMMFSFQIQLSRENFTFSFLTKANQTNKLGSQKKFWINKNHFYQILPKFSKNENLILTRLIVSIFIDYLQVLHILFWQPNKYIKCQSYHRFPSLWKTREKWKLNHQEKMLKSGVDHIFSNLKKLVHFIGKLLLPKINPNSQKFSN